MQTLTLADELLADPKLEEKLQQAYVRYQHAVTGPYSRCRWLKSVLRFVLEREHDQARDLAAKFVVHGHGAMFNAMMGCLSSDAWLVWWGGNPDTIKNDLLRNAGKLQMDPSEAPAGFYATGWKSDKGNICRQCDWRPQCNDPKTDLLAPGHRCKAVGVTAFRDGKTYYRKDGCNVIFKRIKP